MGNIWGIWGAKLAKTQYLLIYRLYWGHTSASGFYFNCYYYFYY